MRIGLSQTNPTVGSLDKNTARIIEHINKAKELGVELLVFPELAVCGYPPEDLLLREDFLLDCHKAITTIATHTDNIVVLVGYPEFTERGPYNTCAVLSDGVIQAKYHKMHLPNYGVFDEKRYFRSGENPALIKVNNELMGITICEDIWEPGPPMNEQALAGASVILNLSASPYHKNKGYERENKLLAQRARDNMAAIVYCNMVGGQDELVFDGHSLVLDHNGNTVARARQFHEELLIADLDTRRIRTARLRDTRRYTIEPEKELEVLAELNVTTKDKVNLDEYIKTANYLEKTPHKPTVSQGVDVTYKVAPILSFEAEVYGALVTGVRDYVHKNGFKEIVFGLSGGIDSALVALVAHDALGKENVHCIVMPSQYSSDETQNDARRMGDNLGIDTKEIPIEPIYKSLETALSNDFAGTEHGVAEENLQARIRGNLLMAMSNKFNWLLLTTGNKSEMSVGYATLYGDMAGGLAVIKDVPKLLVYALSEWRNSIDPTKPCPVDIITRPPSAELREDQQDTDSLPEYDVLDPLLEMYIEEEATLDEILSAGFDHDTVKRVIRLVDLAEYKRRQAPPGIKITTKAFGRDRRRPLTNGYNPFKNMS